LHAERRPPRYSLGRVRSQDPPPSRRSARAALPRGLVVVVAVGVAVGVAAGVVAAPAPARADLGRNGDPIQTSDYTLDLYEGPTLAGARVIGLGGAYAPIAEGVAGYAYNPAAVAIRLPWSVSWFDWEVDAGLTLPSSITGTDFDNNGDQGYTNSADIFLTAGFGLQFGGFGVGGAGDLHRYRIESRAEGSEGDRLYVNVARSIVVGGYAFRGGEIILGLGAGGHYIWLTRPTGQDDTEQEIASVYGPVVQAGVLWAPAWLPLRAGLAVRYSPPEASVPEGVDPTGDDYISEGYYLPRTLSLGTEIQGGVAFQLFRPLNFRWVNPHDEDSAARRAARFIAEARARRRSEAERRLAAARAAGKDEQALEHLEQQIAAEQDRAERDEAAQLQAAKRADRARRLRPYRTMPRDKLLVTAAVKVTAPVRNGVGLESFLEQRVERSGAGWSISPRLGVESEILPNWLVVRAGSYFEPTRFLDNEEVHGRVHGTGGLDVHVPLATDVLGLLDDPITFRVGGAVDAASRYFGWSVSAGIWR